MNDHMRYNFYHVTSNIEFWRLTVVYNNKVLKFTKLHMNDLVLNEDGLKHEGILGKSKGRYYLGSERTNV